MKNLTYSQLIELAPKDRPFQIEVKGSTHWAFIDSGQMLRTLYTNKTMSGTFTLIDPRYQKPEVLKAGQKVRILESILDTLGECEDLPVGRIATIEKVVENQNGLKYRIETWYVPHYCVMPVVEEEEDDLALSLLINDLEELLRDIDKNNYNFLQEIISKYKKWV